MISDQEVDMDKRYEKIQECLKYVRSVTDFEPEIALILGSGLGDYAKNMEVDCEIPYSDIPGFPVSTAPGHDGRFIFGRVAGKKLVCMKGRVHYYEGYDISDVVLPTRLMRLLGAKILFLTNASGGMNKSFKPGDFMLLSDHISIFAPNPLVGPNIDELGVRFPDMSHVYDPELSKKIKETAAKLSIDLKEGIYAQLTGPSYESPMEIRMLGQLGVDAVGMSTVVEAIAGNHCGFRICCISCICNLAAGIADHELTGEEVIEAGKAAAPLFEKLVTNSIEVF